MTSPLCIIPARGGSKRFPGKNLALLRGKSLLARTVECAQDSGIFADICVSSEKSAIREAARDAGASIVLQRPQKLAGDRVGYKSVCAQVLNTLATQGKTYSHFAILLTTTPLRTTSSLMEAHELFLRAETDVLMSLTPYNHPPQRAVSISNGLASPHFGLEFMTQTQRLEPLYRHDGSVLIIKTAPFLDDPDFYNKSITPYITPVENSVDIDSPLDLDWAEFLLSRK